MPSGVWPTVTVLTTRGGLAFTSITLIGVGIALTATDVGDDSNVALGGDVDAIGPHARVDLALGQLDLAPSIAEHRNLVGVFAIQ